MTAVRPTLRFNLRAVEALCDVVREQVALGQAIYPQGGRTALDYGGPPGRPASRSTRPGSAG